MEICLCGNIKWVVNLVMCIVKDVGKDVQDDDGDGGNSDDRNTEGRGGGRI